MFDAAVNVYAGNYDAAAGSDIVVITSGVARKPGQTRIMPNLTDEEPEKLHKSGNALKDVIAQVEV